MSAPDAGRAVVVGAAGIDTNVYLAGGRIDWDVESNFAVTVDVTGQAGAYAARSYARLGMATTLIAAVGADDAGDRVTRDVAAWGIDTVWLHDPQRTHRSVNLVYQDGSRKNFYDGGGSMEIGDPGLEPAVFSGAAIVHVHIEDWCRHLLGAARASGGLVACDLQDVVDLDDPYRQDFVRSADVLFFSAVDQRDPAVAARELLRRSAGRAVVAGLGARGALVATHEGVTHLPPVVMDEPVVDTNGAGDSLAVGTLWSLVVDGTDPVTAVQRGQVAARWLCSRRAGEKEPIDGVTLRRLCVGW
jgi:sugar/nucleoside kinase (ribokinase family)